MQSLPRLDLNLERIADMLVSTSVQASLHRVCLPRLRSFSCLEISVGSIVIHRLSFLLHQSRSYTW